MNDHADNRQRGSVLVTVLAVLMMLEIAAAAAFAGYYVFTGKISAEQTRLVYKSVKGEVTEQMLADATSWTKHQEEEAAKAKPVVAGADAASKLAATNEQSEAARLGIERQFKELQDREGLVQRKIEELEQRRKSLAEIEKRIDDKVAREKQGTGQQSFQKMMGIVKAMKPPALKEIMAQMDDASAVDVLKSLDSRAAAKVLEEFKTPVEQDRKRHYLDMIRNGDMATSKTTAGG